MRTSSLILLAASLSMSFTASPLRADLITDGNFETPVVPTGGFINFPSGSTAITGWTVAGPQASIVSGAYVAGCCHFPAEAGSQWLDLTGDLANSVEGVEQTVTTVPGTSYTLSYWVGNVNDPTGFFGHTSSVKVLVNGTLIDTATNSANSTTLSWEQFTDTFTASGTSTTIEFLNNDPSSDNSNGLDNVTLNPTGVATVPEPSSMMLLTVPAAALFLLRRRRKQRS